MLRSCSWCDPRPHLQAPPCSLLRPLVLCLSSGPTAAPSSALPCPVPLPGSSSQASPSCLLRPSAAGRLLREDVGATRRVLSPHQASPPLLSPCSSGLFHWWLQDSAPPGWHVCAVACFRLCLDLNITWLMAKHGDEADRRTVGGTTAGPHCPLGTGDAAETKDVP